MSKSIKGLLLGLVSLVVLALGVSTANAYTVSPGGAFTATSLGQLNLESDIVTLNCNVSLSGSLNTSISNTLPAPAGSVTSGSVTNCDDGFSVDLLFGTWGLVAQRFTANTAAGNDDRALINITGVGFQVNFLGSPVCLFGGDVGFEYDEATGLITILANELSGDCGTGRLAAGSQFALSPAQNIS